MTLWDWLFHRRQRQEELDEEVQSHLRMAARGRMEQGGTAEQARTSAVREFGNVTLVKEVTRDMWGSRSLETLMQDLRFGLRMLRKNPGFTAVAVVTLALGIGANTAIFSVVDQVLLRSTPYKDPNRLVMIWETYLHFPKVWVSVPNFYDWQAQTRAFEGMSAYRVRRGFTLTGHGEPERLQGTYVTANLFDLLGVKPAQGRLFLAAEDKLGASL